MDLKSVYISVDNQFLAIFFIADSAGFTFDTLF